MTYTIDVHLSPDEVRQRMRADAIAGLQADAEIDPAGVVLRRARQPALRGDHPAARVLPHPGRTRACWRRTRRPSPSCRRRTRWSSSAPGACEKTRVLLDRAATARHAGPLRALRRQRRVPPRRRLDPLRRVRRPGGAPGHRRLQRAPGGDPHRWPPHGRLLGRDHRQPRPGPTCPVPLRPQLHHVERRLAAPGCRSGQGPAAPGGRLRRRRRRDGAVQQERPPRAQHSNSAGTSIPICSPTWPCGTRRSSGSRCGCGPQRPTDVTLREAGISVHFAEGEEILTEISAKFTPERIEEELRRRGLRDRRHVGRRRGRVPPHAGPPVLLTTSGSRPAPRPAPAARCGERHRVLPAGGRSACRWPRRTAPTPDDEARRRAENHEEQ